MNDLKQDAMKNMLLNLKEFKKALEEGNHFEARYHERALLAKCNLCYALGIIHNEFTFIQWVRNYKDRKNPN